MCVKRCNAKGGDYENGDSSKWRQRWAWGYIGGNTSGSARREVKRGIPKEGDIKSKDGMLKEGITTMGNLQRVRQGGHGGA